MLKGQLETFSRYRYLLYNLVSRDFKVKYRRSVLGIAWSLLNPIMMMLVLNAVFSHVFRFDVANFPLYLISGQVIYQFFSESTSGAIFSVVEASSLIKKVYIPKYIFPAERVIFGFVNLGLSLVALTVMLVIFRVQFTFTMLLCVVPLVALLIFTMGFSLVISALCVFFRDLKHLYTVLLTVWMYLTPIIYPMSVMEGSWIYPLVRINPLTWYVEAFRGTVLYNTVPSLTTNLVCYGYAFVFLGLGLVLFKKLQDKFILYI